MCPASLIFWNPFVQSWSRSLRALDRYNNNATSWKNLVNATIGHIRNQIQLSMKGYRPPITSWRAFVNCEQIGYRFSTKAEAEDAARSYIESQSESESMAVPVTVIRPSYSPVNRAVLDETPLPDLATS